MKNKKKTILVTSALPYANGPIHLGHLVEYIQTDIWVRFQKLVGNDCYYICADDAHGTPIMLKAKAENISPKELVDKIHKEHNKDFSNFLIEFNNFYTTHSSENKSCAEDIYNKLEKSGYIYKKEIMQSYDKKQKMFLPDRFVKGKCPKCTADDQYGDNCEVCGATYSPKDLINPISALSGDTPIEKASIHYFFNLPMLSDFLINWLDNANIQDEIKNKMKEWFTQGLKSWDISRDAPYWGFNIPGTTDKFFYVWLDAPIGYMASFLNFANNNNLDFNHFWKKNSDVELYHFIGKDIAYFHTLFWPAMLEASGYRTPTGVFCHGFLTINGNKMSKSRGVFIDARSYLDVLNPECLRYYYASKLSSKIEDIDLNLEDFKKKYNSDVVGKLVNLASRCAGFIQKRFDGSLSKGLDSEELFLKHSEIINKEIIEDYNNRDYSKAIRKVISILDEANEYIDREKPWIIAKDENNSEKLHNICTSGINSFYQVITILQPVMPELCKSVYEYLNLNYEKVTLENVNTPLLNHKVNKFTPLAKRIEDKQIERWSKENMEKNNKDNKKNNNLIEFNDFIKTEIRVGLVKDCSFVEGSNKLLCFKLDDGTDKERQIFSGIRKYYESPEELVNKKVLFVSNLKPRKMSFGLSEGMILSSEGETGVHLIFADSKSNPGDLIG